MDENTWYTEDNGIDTILANQYLDYTVSTISNTTNKVTRSINKYQKITKEIFDKGIDTTNKYQQQIINIIQLLSDNSIYLQQNLVTTFQSSFSKFIDDTFKSYCNNFIFPTTYSNLYSKSNQNIIDSTALLI